MQTLSLVIPAYNEEAHIARCLDAIARQTVPPDEVIVVNNNSTDRTVAITALYPFVRLVSEKRQGIVYARNCGFNGARGSILGRIDADTILPATWVQDVKQFYADPDRAASALTGGCVPVNMHFPRAGSWLVGNVVYPIGRLLLGHYPLYGSNMALPATAWQAVRRTTCVRGDIDEDIDLAIHLHRRGYEIVVSKQLIVGATIRRMRGEFGALWSGAKRWPRILRTHHNRWWMVALFESLLLVASSVLVMGLDLIVWLSRGQPLPEWGGYREGARHARN